MELEEEFYRHKKERRDKGTSEKHENDKQMHCSERVKCDKI